MYIVNLIAFIFIGLFLLVMLGLSFTRWFTERAAYKFATSVGIGLTEDFLPAVRSRLALQQRGAPIVGLIGLFIATLFLVNDAQLTDSTTGSLTFAGIVIASMSVGSALTAVRSHSHRDPDQPRLARASVITMADYVAPLERKGAFIAVAFSVATMFIFVVGSGVIHTSPLPWISGPSILAVLSVASLVLFEVVGRRILRSGQPAGSPTELAWDDALRSQRLRSLLAAPLVLSAYGAFSSLTELSTAFSAAGNPALALVFSITSVVLGCAVFVMALIALITRPQRFFLRRLWPEAEAVA
jgi:hypothetical protein